MFTKKYRFKFYLNARHMVEIKNYHSRSHPHTWEIVTLIIKQNEDFVEFSSIENVVQSCISVYEGCYLNDHPHFKDIVPTMENIGEVVAGNIARALKPRGWVLERTEISENPSRTYILMSKGIDTSTDVEKVDVFEELCALGEDPLLNIENTECQLEHQYIQEPNKPYDQEEKKEVHFPSNFRLEGEAKIRYLLTAFIIVMASALLLGIWIFSTGRYPWGSDTWGHLFKTDLLFDEAKKGNIFPLYSGSWYNGTQPFRYWAPFPYYVLLLVLFVTGGDIVIAYNGFILLAFIAGAIAWILWGVRTGRGKTALALGVLWFFLPDNLRVLFSEGNIPRVVVTCIFPYLLLGVHNYIKEKRWRSLTLVSLCMFLITLSHAMISAMTGITVFVYLLLVSIIKKDVKVASKVLAAVILGIGAAGIWLIPALKGGMLSLDQESVKEVMKMYTFPMLQSLNPLYRLSDPEIFYFGLSIFLVLIMGIIFSPKESKICFVLSMLVFVITASEFTFLLIKMPAIQLFWPTRFIPLALGIFFVGILEWRQINQKLLAAIILLILVDSIFSFTFLCRNKEYPVHIEKDIKESAAIADQRVGVLDLSSYGSFPGYYISTRKDDGKPEQIFGWAWQGARTSSNIVWLNTALEKGWYSFLFDRCLELGADTLVVKKDIVKFLDKLVTEAEKAGYEMVGETDTSITLKYPVDFAFGTKVRYNGFAIGSYACNISYMFPQFEIGGSLYLDDYSVDDLMDYDTIYLSGFKYKSKISAEKIVSEISQKGVKVVIDLTNAKPELFTSRASFLNVVAEPVLFKDKFPALNVNGANIELEKYFPREYEEWRAFYLENLDTVEGQIEFWNQSMDFIGTKMNDNIVFIGLNLPFYAMETMDNKGIELLESVIGFKAQEVPKREIIPMEIQKNRNHIFIKTDKEGVNTSIADLDAFRIKHGKYSSVHNLIFMNSKELSIKINYPYFVEGMMITILSIVCLIVFCISLSKNETIRESGRGLDT